MRRVIVTGSTGFIGRHVVAALQNHGFDYITVSHGDNGQSANHFDLDLLSNEDFDDFLSDAKPSHLIHLAWYAEHGKYWNSPLNIDWTRATYRLLHCFYKHGGEHALVSGTCAEYDWRYGYLVEGLTPENPNTLYGIAKDTTRRIAEVTKKEYGATLTWARLFFPYGADEAQARLIPSLFGAFRQERPYFGVNASAYRDFLHVSDLAEALLLCSTKRTDGVVNISSGKAVSIETIVREIARICNQDADQILRNESERKGDPEILIGANGKLLDLGWSPRVGLREGLSNY